MDAASTQIKKDNCRLRPVVCAVVFFALCASQNSTAAQVARLAPQIKNVELDYDYSILNPAQAFTPVLWNIQNTRLREGCVVQWTADAFTHSGNQRFRADCDLQVRIVGGTRNADWKVSTPFDATNLAAGKDKATVEINSIRRGNARVSLLVRFTPSPQTTLVGGTYQTTLTGTITGL